MSERAASAPAGSCEGGDGGRGARAGPGAARQRQLARVGICSVRNGWAPRGADKGSGPRQGVAGSRGCAAHAGRKSRVEGRAVSPPRGPCARRRAQGTGGSRRSRSADPAWPAALLARRCVRAAARVGA